MATKKKAKKTSKPSQKSKKPLSWSDKGEELLSLYLKKFGKGSKSALAVFGAAPGEFILHAGANAEGKDWIAISSLVPAMDAAHSELCSLLKMKNSAHVGSEMVWSHRVGSHIILGVGLPYKEAALKDVAKHLGKKPGFNTNDPELKEFVMKEAVSAVDNSWSGNP